MKNDKIVLIKEAFMGFSIGDFPYDREHSALGEYHLHPVKGDCGIWYDPVCNYNYRGPSWIITEDNGIHYMEQMRVVTNDPHIMHPILMAGKTGWRDYTISVRVRLLNTFGEAGVAFGVQNSMNLIAAVLREQKICLIYRHKEQEVLWKEVDFKYTFDDFYEITVGCDKDRVSVCVNQVMLLEYQDARIALGGKVGITATVPAQFETVVVTAERDTAVAAEAEYQARCKKKASVYPGMKLWKIIDLKDFGCGRQIRFGHLTGTGEWHIVLAQCQKRVYKDAYASISCLTAIDLDGNVLWQNGEPSGHEAMGLLSADVPLQVYDIDGDGVDEVIMAKNFEIFILDGRTGAVKKRAKTPVSVESDNQLLGVPFDKYAFYRLNPDGIRIANLSGNERPSDLILKDRYCRIYALNCELELQWKFYNGKNTGHFPFTFDFNGDGKDEIFCGYNMISHDGKLLWTLPFEEDHTDEIVIGKFMEGSDKGHMALVSGTQGFIITDYEGNVLAQDKIGHAQRVSIGHYLGDNKRYGICVVNYWGHQGIIYFYDSRGNTLWEKENSLNGNVLAPVNWSGDGTDLILLQADPWLGGLIDGEGDQVVAFPDDGHPLLCAEAIDLCGDARDELVVWDQKRMYIYTQEDNPKKGVYSPVKYQHYNASNYRGEYSYPDESYLGTPQKQKERGEHHDR